MTQTVKHRALPKNAMMRSKLGKMIATTMNATLMTIGMVSLQSPRIHAVLPTDDSASGMTRESSPMSISMVDMMGRALNGALVIGMIAIHETMIADIAFG